MGDDAIGAAPKKSGCLKWVCGCLLLLVLLGGGTLAVAWHFMAKWTPGESAWERLPPSTRVALEVHDLRAFLGHALNDRGILSLLERVSEQAARRFPARNAEGANNPVEELIVLNRRFDFLFTAIAPNIVLGGLGGKNGGEFFVVFKAPAWMRWYYNFSTAQTARTSGGAVHFIMREGWLIAAESADMLKEILDNWERPAKRLGSAAGDAGPFLSIAVAEEGGGEAAPATGEAAGQPEHFMLGDPFAAAPGTAEGTVESGRAALRLTVFPSADGWRILGETGDRLDTSETPTGLIEKALASLPPPGPAPAGRDVAFSARASDAARTRLLGFLDARGPADPDALHPYRALGWRWLRGGWLANAGGDALLLGAPPAETRGADYPPLPVFSLGWTVAPGVPAERAGREFTNSLGVWLGSLASPGGPEWLQNIRASLRYSTEADGARPSGEIVPPAALVNGVRPAWRFYPDAGPAMGWLATDPAGLPDDGLQSEAAAWMKMAPPEPEWIDARGCWDLGTDFPAAIREAALDRIRTLPASGLFGFDKKDAAAFVDGALGALDAFPRGSVRLRYDVGGGRGLFLIAVPPGVRSGAR